MTRRQLWGTWVAIALLSGGLLLVAEAAEGPRDDPDPAEQRPGYLDAGDLPLPAPPLPGDVPRPRRQTVVFFERPDGLADLCRALRDDDLDREAALVVVVPRRGKGDCDAVPVAVDRSGEYADAIGMRRPRDGGHPVGYAVIDSRGRVRYRTLDPEVDDGLAEVTTIVKAVP